MNVSFSILICCYNSEKYLSETIESIVCQTYLNWEIVIIDDGSTDSTYKIVESYINKNINIKYYYQKNRGFAAARNMGIKLAKNDWIVILDHDDIALPNRLEIHHNQIKKNLNAKLFFANTIHFSDNNSFIRYHFDSFNTKNFKLAKIDSSISLLRYGCFIDSESVVFSKEMSLKIGILNPKYKYLADYEFFVRFGFYAEFDFTEDSVSKWRIHDNQATKKMSLRYKYELITFYFIYLFNNNISNSIKFLLLKKIFFLLGKFFLK